MLRNVEDAVFGPGESPFRRAGLLFDYFQASFVVVSQLHGV